MKRALIDLSSVIWTCLLAGKDTEFGKEYDTEDGKTVFVNSASYGLENAINHILTVMKDLQLQPHQLILVPEGKNSKAERQALHPGYKAGRDRHPAAYEQFNLVKEQLLQTFLDLGAQAAWQDGGVEADDVLAYLAQNLDGQRYIVSGDKDLAALIGPGPKDKLRPPVGGGLVTDSDSAWTGYIHHYRQGQLDKNPFGPFNPRFIPVCIALVGDSSDKIPGARLFGEKAFESLLIAFGDDGLELMEGLIKNRQLRKLEEDVGELKVLKKIIDDADNVYLSYELGRLRVEKVNTVRRPLSRRAGMVKPRSDDMDSRLRNYAGVQRIVCGENYADAFTWMKREIERSPFVSLDVETATPPESDEWLERQGKEDKVDVLGSDLVSLQLTFGPNLQYTVYLPVDNVEVPGCSNITVSQVRDVVNLIPRDMITYIQNVSFELPVCYRAWGSDWADDPEYHGFLRNVRDTKIMSSYTDENYPSGLKENSKRLLGYDQVSYAEVTSKTMLKDQWNGVGKLVQEWVEDEETTEPRAMVKVQYKMNQLTATEVLSYGADDTICTAALANHFRTVMTIESTWDVFEAVETFPAYLTALAFVQGTPISLEDMAAMEKDDDRLYDEAWPVLRDFLIKVGFEGTVCPEMLHDKPALAYLLENDTNTLPPGKYDFGPRGIKMAYQVVTGQDLDTLVRTESKLAKLIRERAEELEDPSPALLLADAIDAKDIDAINALIKSRFDGEPKLDLASPKQMTRLLYDFIGIPIRVINDVTKLERVNKPELDAAVAKFKKIRAGKSDLTMTDEELKLLRLKAKADDAAIDLALAFDADNIEPDAQAAMKAIGTLKKVMTRRSLFYKNYWHAPHWSDGKVHAMANQCAAVTRRYSMSMPNLQQLPKKGDGVRFRGIFKPHCKDGVICSIDYVGQELRLAAERSQDKNMLACYVGENLKDIHSITAAGAMKLKWGPKAVAEYMEKYGGGLSFSDEDQYQLFLRLRGVGKVDPVGKKADDLRKSAKSVNFGAQNGAKAVKLAETLIMTVAEAQLFLDARAAMFPDVDVAAEAAADEAKRLGYVSTMMGARRHLREAMMSDERGAADRAARQAWNFEIQGSAGEMTKMGMTRLWKSGALFRLRARFIAPIHDELVTSVHKDDALEFIRIKHECIAQPYASMQVPILGSISIGPDFANQIECGDWYIADNIKSALNDIFAKEKQAA